MQNIGTNAAEQAGQTKHRRDGGGQIFPNDFAVMPQTGIVYVIHGVGAGLKPFQ